MKPTRAADDTGRRRRPRGFVQPCEGRAAQALKAIHEGRLSDADKHIAALTGPADVDCAWASYLRGMLAFEESDLPAALGHLGEALEHLANDDGSYLSPRLAAAAQESIGRIHRRRERPDSARAAHAEAYRLRQDHGSQEELSETALSLGHAARLTRDDATAKEWFQAAIRHGSAAADPDPLLATAYAALGTLFDNAGQFEEAMDAVRRALHHRHRQDPGSADAARARLRLGRVLLHHGEVLAQQGDPAAVSRITEAIEALESAGEELEPFGSPCASDLATCLELTDFARRLASHTHQTE